MLKLGICEIEQDTPAGHLWRRGLMAASLLPTEDSPSSAAIDRFERLMVQICRSNGVARTTRRGRFDELNKQLEPVLRAELGRHEAPDVEDWAVSSGITAAEWFEHLRKTYAGVQFTASDWMLHLVEARRPEIGDAYILEPDGTPIQYVRAPLVVNLVQPSHPLYFVNNRMRERALRNWQQQLAAKLRLPAGWNEDAGSAPVVTAAPFELRKLPLVHPEVLKLARTGAFRLRRHSVFEPLARPVTVIRTMNILNRAYFSDAQLRTAAAAVERSLRPGGLWIVGRTVSEDPPRHEVTVARRGSDGWEVMHRVGGGSEMDAILSVEARTQAAG